MLGTERLRPRANSNKEAVPSPATPWSSIGTRSSPVMAATWLTTPNTKERAAMHRIALANPRMPAREKVRSLAYPFGTTPLAYGIQRSDAADSANAISRVPVARNIATEMMVPVKNAADTACVRWIPLSWLISVAFVMSMSSSEARPDPMSAAAASA